MALSRPASLLILIDVAWLASPYPFNVQLQPSEQPTTPYASVLVGASDPAIAVRIDTAQPLKVLSLIPSSRVDMFTYEASRCSHLAACNQQ